MAEYILREYRREDFPRLVKLWRDIFGDPEELISAFLQVLPAFGTGAVAEREGLAVGAAYAIDGMDICDGRGGKSRCGYIYAVAVSPEHRHQGLGAALSRRAVELAGPGDVVLIAGKGHENYQEIAGKRYHLDDREVLKDLL